MIRAILISLCLVAPPALGETVRVRSGEHASFSRLVFDFDRPTGWTLRRSSEGYDLQFSRSDIRFDLSRVFRFIPRARLRDIDAQQGAARLMLQVDCTCHANVFEAGSNRVVLDIKDGPPPEALQGNARPASLPSASTAMKEVLRRPRLPVIGDFPIRPVPTSTEPESSGVLPLPDAPPMGTFLPRAGQLTEMKKALLRELGRAAAQGLVEADIRPPPSVHPAPAAPVKVDPPAPPAISRDPAVGIRIETSIDRATPGSERPAMNPSGQPCLPARIFDLSAMKADASASTMIAKARSKLLGEFDRIASRDLRDMVKTYLYLGFGAEAEAVMSTFGADFPNAAVFRAMAHILDDGHAEHPALLDGQIGCPGPVALWAALARPDLPRGVEIDRDAIVSAFSTLPQHLRRHLGPSLAERFLAINDMDTAARIRNALARVGARGGAHLLYMQAKHDLATGNRTAALRKLRRVIAEGRTMEAEALLTMLEAQLEAGQVPDPPDVMAAEAFAREYRGTAMEPGFLRVVILAHARNGDFAAAFDRLALMDSGARPALKRAVLGILSAHGSDVAFLRHVLAMDPGAQRPQAVSRKIAARLLALGFPDRATAFLPVPAPNELKALSVLRAEIALSKGKPAAALSFLDGLSGPGAERVRGAAFSELGDLSAAFESFLAAGDTEQLKTMAWMTGDWLRVSQYGDAAQKEFAALQREKGDTPPKAIEADSPPSLAQARALLAQSRSARKALSGLLARDATGESP